MLHACLNSMCYLQGSFPPRAVLVEEGCEHLQGTSYRRSLLQPNHSWHRSIHLNEEFCCQYNHQWVQTVSK